MEFISHIAPYLSWVKTAVYFILGLGLLIFIHELGHFLIAKLSGIRVEKFSLGFGPSILKFHKGETEYCIALLPLGGYVKMSGQEDFEEGEVVPLDDPRGYSSKSIPTRMGVVCAGPVMNLILPFVIMPLVFILGRVEPKFLTSAPQVMGVKEATPAASADIHEGDLIISVNGHMVANWGDALNRLAKRSGEGIHIKLQRQTEILTTQIPLSDKGTGLGKPLGLEPMYFFDTEPLIGTVAKQSPAEKAGLQVGDQVRAIDGKSIETWNQLSERVASSDGHEMLFQVQRGSDVLDVRLLPHFDQQLSKYLVGIEKGSDPKYYHVRPYPFFAAVKKGFHENLMLFGMTFDFLKELVTGKASHKDLGGPVRIAQILGKAAQTGFANFLYLVAFLSIQLGILNLLPIPVLDGGHVMFLTYEAVSRKSLSMKKKLVMQQIGMVLLMTLIVFVTFNDVKVLGGFDWVIDKYKSWF